MILEITKNEIQKEPFADDFFFPGLEKRSGRSPTAPCPCDATKKHLAGERRSLPLPGGVTETPHTLAMTPLRESFVYLNVKSCASRTKWMIKLSWPL